MAKELAMEDFGPRYRPLALDALEHLGGAFVILGELTPNASSRLPSTAASVANTKHSVSSP
jgi:hypothetical protein